MTEKDLRGKDIVLQAFMPEPKVYTVPEVAKVLRVDVHFVYELVKSGVLPAIKLNSWKITGKALDEFLVKYEGYEIDKQMNATQICPVSV